MVREIAIYGSSMRKCVAVKKQEVRTQISLSWWWCSLGWLSPANPVLCNRMAYHPQGQLAGAVYTAAVGGLRPWRPQTHPQGCSGLSSECTATAQGYLPTTGFPLPA